LRAGMIGRVENANLPRAEILVSEHQDG
jgi:hypothetical protein